MRIVLRRSFTRRRRRRPGSFQIGQICSNVADMREQARDQRVLLPSPTDNALEGCVLDGAELMVEMPDGVAVLGPTMLKLDRSFLDPANQGDEPVESQVTAAQDAVRAAIPKPAGSCRRRVPGSAMRWIERQAALP